MAEPLAPLIAEIVKNGSFSHVVAAHTALGKNVFPRVAALLDVAQVCSIYQTRSLLYTLIEQFVLAIHNIVPPVQISDVQKVVSSDTFERPIYAGNAIATVKSNDKIKIFTVRTAAFEPASEGDKAASIEEGSGSEGEGMCNQMCCQSKWHTSSIF